ncbi:hypothetical protein ElyMa_003541700 [Elysia marginata]|uniref:Transmembrane protein n=1 Tax=Elysia marginata TaxID=1093978 RepID=A0AAV4EJ91_9GAST|nr:hypothetical protein ElyMa_003541700 [Elysia marginata]
MITWISGQIVSFVTPWKRSIVVVVVVVVASVAAAVVVFVVVVANHKNIIESSSYWKSRLTLEFQIRLNLDCLVQDSDANARNRRHWHRIGNY